MRAYRLDEPAVAITPDELAAMRVLSWRVPDDESDRAALV